MNVKNLVKLKRKHIPFLNKDKKNKSISKEFRKRFFANNHFNLIITIITVVIVGAFNISTAFLFKLLSDTAIDGTISDLMRLLKLSFLFIVGYVLISLIKQYFTNRFIARAISQYKNYIFDRILFKNINAFNEEASSRYISALTIDIASIEQNYITGSINIIYQVLLLVGGLISMVCLNWFLTLCVFGAALLPIAVSAIFGDKLTVLEKQTSDRNESFVGLIKDLLLGFSVIKSFQAERQVAATFKSRNNNLEMVKKNRRETASLINIFSFAASFLVTVVVCGVGAYLSIIGKESLGTVIAFVQLLDYVVNPVQALGPAISNRKAAQALIEKIAKSTGINNINVSDNEVFLNSFENRIEFENVSFKYEKDLLALHDINLVFEKGKSYAIVGGSGSGKSTLLNMLLGYHEDYDGDIKVDDVEIKNIPTASLYNLVSIIQQNVFIFDESILSNITMFKEFAETDIENAILQSGLKEFITEKGMNFMCGENGYKLSGGEKQRISIARSLLCHTPIFLMDEATAALDNITSHMIEEAILGIEYMTRIIVTHKMDKMMLRKYDEIIVLRNGKVTDIGKFDELYAKKDYFYSLVNVSQENELFQQLDLSYNIN